MKNRKKILLIGIGILLTLGIVVGVSYAWWTHTVSQNGINTVQSTCLEIELTDENPITLSNAYPITDLEASLLTPYTFTITNKCNTVVEYDVNLDIMETENRLNSEYIAIEFNGNEKKLLNTLTEVETSYPGTDYTPVEGRHLTSGELDTGESVSYSLKLWMDESVTVEDNAMNKNFISKVVVTARQSHQVRLVDLVQLGDYIELTPTSTSYTVSTNLTGYSLNQTINPSELNLWRVIKKNEDGSMEVVSEYTSSNEVTFYGIIGYQKFVGSLNEIAKQYEVEGITIGSRYMGYSDQVQVCNSYEDSNCATDIGYVTDFKLINEVLGTLIAYKPDLSVSSYWIASRHKSYPYFDGAAINSGGALYYSRFIGVNNEQTSASYSIRPIITIKAGILLHNGEGIKEIPYRIINE